MKRVAIIPGAAVGQVESMLRAVGWEPAPHLDRSGGTVLDDPLAVVRHGEPVLAVPKGSKPPTSVRRIVVVHEGSRADRAGMDAADAAAKVSGAEIVVLHVPATTDPTAGALAFRYADHGDYDLAEWRQEFLRRFCRCSPGVQVTLRVGAADIPALAEEVRSESPDLVVLSGPPAPGFGDDGLVDALLDGRTPVLLVPSVGRDRATQADAERGQVGAGQARPGARGDVRLVASVMSHVVISVEASTPIDKVATVLVDNAISGVPVVGPDGQVLGVVSEADLVARAQRQPGGHAAATAADLMTAPAMTVAPDEPIADVARRMADHRVNRLPVVENGSLVGIVTRSDVVRASARPR